jgi:hypothetical protein
MTTLLQAKKGNCADIEDAISNSLPCSFVSCVSLTSKSTTSNTSSSQVKSLNGYLPSIEIGICAL